MTKQILLATIFLGLLSCGQKRNSDANISNVTVEDNYKPTFTVSQLSDNFELGFKQIQSDSFGQILWQKEEYYKSKHPK
ncbi:hypothetical protein [Proteiniphilum sp. UBA1028]|jgi:hypothetical protein|uniref:hypothetical protein n=1 Tax=Proteiniphilum sp. UBA1028 TaxID=1947251 RepID=UPI0025D38F01|nr:hypothetical protein [Proteiniphilum sp. UBA1028]